MIQAGQDLWMTGSPLQIIRSIFDKVPISWISKTQNTVSLPSTEAEYNAVSAGQEAVWFRRILHNFKLESTNYYFHFFNSYLFGSGT
jgi:hypothetical protein